MTFAFQAVRPERSTSWVCSCGRRRYGKTCTTCLDRRPEPTQEESQIDLDKAHEKAMRLRAPRTWRTADRLAEMALMHPDAGVRDRAATWLCAVDAAGRQGQEMSEGEVSYVMAQVKASPVSSDVPRLYSGPPGPNQPGNERSGRMALRGVAPTTVPKRLKALFFGPAGAGKTMTAIRFPKPYLIDTEKGAENEEYVKLLNASGGAYYFMADFDDILQEVTTLLTEKHEYRTLIIDPLTVPYNDLLDKAALSLATKDDPAGTAFGRHKNIADRKLKRLLNLLLRLDMNVIITSHQKAKWEKVGADLKEVGKTFDCYAKLDYLFDLVFEVEARGKERVGYVHKTRVSAFPEGETFPFNYAEIAKRYGAEVLERKAVAQQLATPEQVKTLKRLVELLKVDEDIVDKWLSKSQASSFEEMPTTVAQKCIEWCEARVKGEEPAPEPKSKAKRAAETEVAKTEEVAHAV